MTTENKNTIKKICDINNGPCKFDIMISLFNDHIIVFTADLSVDYPDAHCNNESGTIKIRSPLLNSNKLNGEIIGARKINEAEWDFSFKYLKVRRNENTHYHAGVEYRLHYNMKTRKGYLYK
jgi:hypothetical protein